MGFTPNQWAILALSLVLGWLLGLMSRSGGARWRRAYEDERAARTAADARAAAAQERIAVMEREAQGRIGSGTTAAIGAAASGDRDDLALIRGVGRGGETRLNDAGIHSYRQVSTLSDGDASALENQLGLKTGTIALEEWREQASLLRDRKIDEHRVRYAA